MQKISTLAPAKLVFGLAFALNLAFIFSIVPFSGSEAMASTPTTNRREGIPPRRFQGGTRVLPKLPSQLGVDLS